MADVRQTRAVVVAWRAATLGLIVGAVGALHSPAVAAPRCVGDCDAGGLVRVADVVLGVRIALGEAPLSTCPAFDTGGGTVTIDALVTAVGNALRGCPPDPSPTGAPPTPTPTPPSDPLLRAIAAAFGGLCDESALSNYAQGTADGYYAYCSASGSQSASLRARRYDDVAAAVAAFADASRVGPPYDFEHLPAAYWERGFNRPTDGGSRTMVWQLACWVVTVDAFDNYGGRLAIAPPAASRAVYDAAAGLLLADCPEEQPAPTPSPTRRSGPDLVVASISAAAHNGSCQPYASLGVCIANAGRTAAGAFTVAIEPIGDRFVLDGLGSGEALCSSRPFPYRGSQPLTVTADAGEVVDEIDEANNTLSTVVPYPSVEATCVPTRTPTAGG